MTKSELIAKLITMHPELDRRDIAAAARSLLDQMAGAIARGERIEIRGFGSFSLHYRRARMGRNPKTGAPVALPGRHLPHFKPGVMMRWRINKTAPDSRTGE